MRKIELVFLFVFLQMTLFVAAQETVYMPFFETLNVNKEYQYSTARLLKVYVENGNKYELILPEKWDSVYVKETLEQTRQKAEAVHARYFLTGEMNRIGGTVIISVNMYQTSDGKKYWHGMYKAANPSDIDPVITKIALGLGDNSKATSEDIYNVSQYESNELKKIGSNKFFGVFIGGGTTFVTNVKKNFPAGFGLLYSFDNRGFIFDVKGKLFFSDVDIYSINFDALYPLTHKSSSFYLSGGLGYGGITITNKESNNYPSSYYSSPNSGSGLTLTGGMGYLMNRNSDVMVRFGAEIDVPLFTVSNNNLPVAVLITATMLFGR